VSLDLVRGKQTVVPLTNKTGGTVVKGDVVIIDSTNDAAFTTTTAARYEGIVGIVQEAIANNGSGRVLTAGYADLVNVPASVTRGHYIETHTVAKQATGSAARRSGSLGQFLTGGTTPTALIGGLPDQAAAAATASVRVKVTGSSTSVGSSWTALLFPSEAYDPDGFHSTASNTDLLTVPSGKDGTFAVLGQVGAATAPGAGIFQLSLQKNSEAGDGFGHHRVGAGAAQYDHMQVAGEVELAVGDTVRLRAGVGSGTMTPYDTFLSMHRV
jgi:hypothetical protein